MRRAWATFEFYCSLFLVRVLRSTGFVRRSSCSVLLLPATKSDKGLGDETMMKSVAYAMRQHACREVHLLHYNRDDSWKRLHCFDKEIDVFDKFYRPKVGDWLRLCLRLAHYSHFFCLGADVVDGHHSPPTAKHMLRILRAAGVLRLDARLLGFSWNQEPSKEIIAAFKALPDSVLLVARDPTSCMRLRRRLTHSIVSAADTAFSFHHQGETPHVAALLDWCRTQREDPDRLLLGINLSSMAFNIENDEDGATVIGNVSQGLFALKAQHPKLSIVAIPHDLRKFSTPSDIELAQALVLCLKKDFGEAVQCLPADIDPEDISAIVQKVDLVFTGRMHLAIAALRNGIPIACVPYQGKFKGLIRLFVLSDVVIDPEDAQQPELLCAFLHSCLERRAEFKTAIASHLPEILRLSALNFCEREELAHWTESSSSETAP